MLCVQVLMSAPDELVPWPEKRLAPVAAPQDIVLWAELPLASACKRILDGQCRCNSRPPPNPHSSSRDQHGQPAGLVLSIKCVLAASTCTMSIFRSSERYRSRECTLLGSHRIS